MFFDLRSVYCDNKMGGVILETEYPFEIDEINPIYLSESDAWKKIEQMLSALLEILDGK